MAILAELIITACFAIYGATCGFAFTGNAEAAADGILLCFILGIVAILIPVKE